MRRDDDLSPHEEYQLRIERLVGGGQRLGLREVRAGQQTAPWLEFQDTDALLRHLWTLVEPTPGLK
ncbi:hypothetical protein K7W42_00735 [Deinococcus sp. HMF7604]|uniref:hypothetical protein n=1 Tax=Deinococcus betulae TaxID=2873312 RepID=UPI001CCFC593|nr:hypothetical protein [Deinococcus betulae]MBZ9749377.1 hypothetical protein [Deinococcus betulae]